MRSKKVVVLAAVGVLLAGSFAFIFWPRPEDPARESHAAKEADPEAGGARFLTAPNPSLPPRFRRVAKPAGDRPDLQLRKPASPTENTVERIRAFVETLAPDKQVPVLQALYDAQVNGARASAMSLLTFMKKADEIADELDIEDPGAARRMAHVWMEKHGQGHDDLARGLDAELRAALEGILSQEELERFYRDHWTFVRSVLTWAELEPFGPNERFDFDEMLREPPRSDH